MELPFSLKKPTTRSGILTPARKNLNSPADSPIGGCGGGAGMSCEVALEAVTIPRTASKMRLAYARFIDFLLNCRVIIGAAGLLTQKKRGGSETALPFSFHKVHHYSLRRGIRVHQQFIHAFCDRAFAPAHGAPFPYGFIPGVGGQSSPSMPPASQPFRQRYRAMLGATRYVQPFLRQ